MAVPPDPNYADCQVDRAARLGRKGALTAYRDATVLKVIYGLGLRCREAAMLDVVDWYRNPRATKLGRFGMLSVRWGKATRGSPLDKAFDADEETER